jgi:Leu/Phe-tRNA-protein transferase
MPELIHPISPADLQEDSLREALYPNLERTFYWSNDWDPDFYIALARAGFISISYRDPEHNPEHGTVLLPELQRRYAVLDWQNLHISSRIRKLTSSGRLEEEGIELRVLGNHERVLNRVLDYHGRGSTWLTEPYCELLGRLPTGDQVDFALHGIELWSRKRDLLVAGEFGYTMGTTYTSLSGFCTRRDPRWRGFGTLQMVLLAERLKERGFAFWNMGHPEQAYKRALGAKLVERKTFLKRWLDARDARPDRPLDQSNDSPASSGTNLYPKR